MKGDNQMDIFVDDQTIIGDYFKLRSCRRVAEKYHCSGTTIRRVLIRNGVKRCGWKQTEEYALPKKKYVYKPQKMKIPASYNVKCAYCGKDFVAHRKNKQFCSVLCKDLSIRKRKGIACNLSVEPFRKVCKACGKEYETRREASVTCSSECAKAYRKPRYERIDSSPKTCIVCGKEFSPVQVRQLTCSVECRREHRLQSHRDRNAKYREQEEPERSRLQFVRLLVAYSNSKIPRTCERCGETFYSEYATKKYCSKKCARPFRHRDDRIPKYRWIDSDITVRKLYKRDKGKCYLCGGQCDFSDWRVAESGHKYPGDLYPTKDHVIPVSLGGCESWDNVRLAHWKCNIGKSNDVVSVSPIPKKIAYSEKWRPNARKTAQYSLDGELIRVWDSTAQIRRELGLNDSHIQNVCRRDKSNTGNAYGYHWEYVREQNESCCNL